MLLNFIFSKKMLKQNAKVIKKREAGTPDEKSGSIEGKADTGSVILKTENKR